MKKVFMFHYPKNENFHDYYIDSLDPTPYFQNDTRGTLRDLLNGGRGRYLRMHNFGYAHEIDTLYRTKNKNYMRYIDDFLDKFRDFDIFILSTYNTIHPEIIHKHLKDKIKVLGFIDDPYSTYTRGIPYLWAFDGAFYISPSYGENELFEDAMKKWGVENSIWSPLCPMTIEPPANKENFFKNRNIDLVYIGSYSGASKLERIVKLKKHFKDRFKIYGRWPLKGYAGAIRGLFGLPFFMHKVHSISNEERQNIYFNTKIGINIHVSPAPAETGNMRMYEVPYHGMMQICDKAGKNAHEMIYEPNKEAVFYDNINEAIELIEYYLSHDEERIKIAQAGHERTVNDYNWASNTKRLLDWAWSLKNDKRK